MRILIRLINKHYNKQIIHIFIDFKQFSHKKITNQSIRKITIIYNHL